MVEARRKVTEVLVYLTPQQVQEMHLIMGRVGNSPLANTLYSELGKLLKPELQNEPSTKFIKGYEGIVFLNNAPFTKEPLK
jgi:hypothetical protein